MTPNWFSTFAFVLWPMVAFFLYLTRPANQATLWTILGGWLLLPAGVAIKFEMVPQFDKSFDTKPRSPCRMHVGPGASPASLVSGRFA